MPTDSGMRRICVVTGTRAEYGLLYWLMRALKESRDVTLQVVATAAHLADEFGHTIDVIRKDGFAVDAEVHMLLASDTPIAVAKSMGLGMIGLADAFARLRPDIVVLLGDRFETLAAAATAAAMRVAVAHIHGGEISEGAIDNMFRHAITKLSHIHFVAAEPFRRRVIQMGEAPECVFTVGAPGLDNLARLSLPGKEELAERVGLKLDRPHLLATYHPATLGDQDPAAAVEELLAALDRFPELALIFTKANADAGGRAINARLQEYVSANSHRAVLADSLGQEFYLSALKSAAAVIGNSSSGIIEAPAAGVPTINIGDRQKGRPSAASIIGCRERRDGIEAAIRRALDPAWRERIASDTPPYGRSVDAAGTMAAHLRTIALDGILVKRFHDGSGASA